MRLPILAGMLCNLLAAASLPAMAAEADIAPSQVASRGPITFDIPAQALTSALDAYGKSTGMQVLYDSRLASGRRTAGVRGSLTPEAALKDLLAGTDFLVRYTDTNDIVLLPASQAAAADDVASSVDAPVLALETLQVEDSSQIGRTADYRAYAGIVQADIQAVLHRNADTRSGSYNIGIKLWVGGSGLVLRSEVFRSTGSQDRDAAIARALRDITISKPPPANMPQPVSVVIAAHGM